FKHINSLQRSIPVTTARERLAALDELPAAELCGRAADTLDRLVSVMNEETTLLRAGRMKDAGALTAEKTALAQDYVTYTRAIQRQLERLRREAPDAVALLRSGHERLATQMADNLRVIATARAGTEDRLTAVARTVGQGARAKTYGPAGTSGNRPQQAARGSATNAAP